MYRNICFGKIKFPRGAIGDDGKQFVKGLLNRNPKHRLGAQGDAQDLKEHAFFKDIDWEALAAKRITPPFKPLVESDESTANFDPEFTETNLSEVAVIPDFDGVEVTDEDLDVGMGSNGRRSNQGAGPTGAVAIQKRRGETAEDEDSPLTRSVQEKFRGFSYSGTYEGSTAGSFGGRRGSAGLAGGGVGFAFQMSKVDMSDDDGEGQGQAAVDAAGRAVGGPEVEMDA